MVIRRKDIFNDIYKKCLFGTQKISQKIISRSFCYSSRFLSSYKVLSDLKNFKRSINILKDPLRDKSSQIVWDSWEIAKNLDDLGWVRSELVTWLMPMKNRKKRFTLNKLIFV